MSTPPPGADHDPSDPRADPFQWRVDAADLTALRSALGNDVLVALCQCWVQVDRINALGDMAELSDRAYPNENNPLRNRNMHAVAWLTIGTMRELMFAVKALRAAVHKRGWLADRGPHWDALDALVRKWDSAPGFRKLRDEIAFHVDHTVLGRGLDALATQGLGATVLLGHGREKRTVDVTWPLGINAAIAGVERSTVDPGMALMLERKVDPDADLREFATATWTDRKVALESLNLAFADVFKRVGVNMVIRDTPESTTQS